MKILLDRLTATPCQLDFEASPSWWQEQMIDGRELDYRVEERFRFDIEAYVLADDVLL